MITLEVISDARKLKELDILRKFDSVDITDSGNIEVSFETAEAARDMGIEPILNIACNARSEEEIKSYVDRAYRRDISSIMILAGNEWTGDVKPSEIIRYASRYRPMKIGSSFNNNSQYMEREMSVARRKVKNGAKFFLTQPIWDYRNVDGLGEKIGNAEIYWGIFPIKDPANIPKMDGLGMPEFTKYDGESFMDITRRLYTELLNNGRSIYVMGRRYVTIEKVISSSETSDSHDSGKIR
jgi:5,10-methylenetetrahydrofolate reductase